MVRPLLELLRLEQRVDVGAQPMASEPLTPHATRSVDESEAARRATLAREGRLHAPLGRGVEKGELVAGRDGSQRDDLETHDVEKDVGFAAVVDELDAVGSELDVARLADLHGHAVGGACVSLREEGRQNVTGLEVEAALQAALAREAMMEVDPDGVRDAFEGVVGILGDELRGRRHRVVGELMDGRFVFVHKTPAVRGARKKA